MNRRSLGCDGLLLDGALTPVSGVPQGLWVKAPGHESLIGLGWVRGEALDLEGANRLGRTPRQEEGQGEDGAHQWRAGTLRAGGREPLTPSSAPLPTRPGGGRRM